MESKRSLLKSLNNNFLLLLVAIVLLILLSIMTIYESQMILKREDLKPRAVKGVLDLTNVDFSDQRFVRLSGETAFYWHELLSPEDIRERTDPPHYVTLPSSWNGEIINGETLGGFGYATYHLRIKVDSPGMYGIKVKEFETAFRIWINSEPLGGAGKVGTSRKEMKPSWQRQEFYFYVPDGTVDVVLQISNFQHRHGGAAETMLFGSMDSLISIKEMRMGIETFLLGLLIVLFLYHLTLYIYRKADKSILYFAMTCMFLLFRLSTTGEKLLIGLFRFIPWEVAIRLEYLSLPLTGLFLVAFVTEMLPQNIPLWFKRSINYIALLISVLIIVLPATIFTYTIFAISFITMYLVIGLFIFLLKAHIQQLENSLGLFLGFTLVFFVMVNDVLAYLGVINSSYLLPFGLIILMLTQAFIISRNQSLAFVQVENLSEKLEKHTEKLEETVMKRTRELREQYSKIELQKNKIETQAEILNQTNQKLLELDKFKKEMTHMMVHDLKNPLANIIGFMQLPEITERIQGLVQASGQDMQNMIQNILDVTKYEETELKLNPEKQFLHQLAEAAFKQNEYNIKLRLIHVENTIPSDLQLNVDKKLLIRVFSNIISNATRYMDDEGLIRVSSTMNKNTCTVSIFNSGKTIPEDKLRDIFDIYTQIYSKRGDHSYSSGIGLAFCKMAVTAHGGEIGVISKENEGVTFWFTLPVTGNL